MKIPLRFLSFVITSLLCASLFAQQNDEALAAPSVDTSKGGFVGRNYAYSRLQDAQLLPSGSVIRVTGRIAGRIKENTYLLEEPDQSDNIRGVIEGGRIAVEIDDDLWQGQVIEAADMVEIIGEVERSDGIATLKAKKVTKDLAYARRRDQLAARHREREAARQGGQQRPSADQAETRRNPLGEQIERRLQGTPVTIADSNAREVALIFVNETIETPLTQYRINTGNYPTTKQGLAALLEAPAENAANWRGPYIKNLPNDPWGRPYQYRFPGIHNLRSYDLWSYGPDGVESADDINNWPASRTD